MIMEYGRVAKTYLNN